jgi:hypothetical protein
METFVHAVLCSASVDASDAAVQLEGRGDPHGGMPSAQIAPLLLDGAILVSIVGHGEPATRIGEI